MAVSHHTEEVRRGERFEFGENWARFLNVVDERRILIAEDALRHSLNVTSLEGKVFLDIGSGSGLSSLAAYRLGATVFSFDYDEASVRCTEAVRQKFAHGDAERWTISTGSVLDTEYLSTLPAADIVYSWGVLHHTGDMWTALDNVSALVQTGGMLCIAIYNDQGGQSSRWKTKKRIYNKLPAVLRFPYTVLTMGPREIRSLLVYTVRGNPGEYFKRIKRYPTISARGMSYWHDVVDWIGGYPFEVATPSEVFTFFRRRDFTLEHLSTVGGGLGCNEYVFSKQA